MKKRIITTADLPGRCLFKKDAIEVREINLNPDFISDEKEWEFIKVGSSETKVIPWIIKYEDIYYTALQYFRWRLYEVVEFYKSDKNGNITDNECVLELPGYVDLESACDLFITKIKTKQL